MSGRRTKTENGYSFIGFYIYIEIHSAQSVSPRIVKDPWGYLISHLAFGKTKKKAFLHARQHKQSQTEQFLSPFYAIYG